MWGGDFNRPPQQLEAETAQNGLGTRCFYRKGVHSTCSNGGLIDYFVSHISDTDLIRDVGIVHDSPISPHYLVECTIPANIKDTMVKEQVQAPTWPTIIGPLLEPWSWGRAEQFLEEQGWKAPYHRFSDARQEHYSLSIGTKDQSIRFADRYSVW